MTLSMVKAHILGLMVISMRVSGKMKKKMVKVLILRMLAISTKGSLKMKNLMV